MKLAVLGEGALGRWVVERARGYNLEAVSVDSVEATHKAKPDAVINCLESPGVASPMLMLEINAVFPHELAATGLRIINMSTDRVFSGKGRPQQPISSETTPDPDDLYGRSKLAGEVQADNVLNVRGSWLDPSEGLLYELLHNTTYLKGWAREQMGPTSAREMAGALVGLALRPLRSGVVHVSTRRWMSHLALVEWVKAELDLPYEIVPTLEPVIWRVLEPDIEVLGGRQMLAELLRPLRR